MWGCCSWSIRILRRLAGENEPSEKFLTGNFDLLRPGASLKQTRVGNWPGITQQEWTVLPIQHKPTTCFKMHFFSSQPWKSDNPQHAYLHDWNHTNIIRPETRSHVQLFFFHKAVHGPWKDNAMMLCTSRTQNCVSQAHACIISYTVGYKQPWHRESIINASLACHDRSTQKSHKVMPGSWLLAHLAFRFSITKQCKRWTMECNCNQMSRYALWRINKETLCACFVGVAQATTVMQQLVQVGAELVVAVL